MIVRNILDVKRLPTGATVWEEVFPRGGEMNNYIMGDLYLDIDSVTK